MVPASILARVRAARRSTARRQRRRHDPLRRRRRSRRRARRRDGDHRSRRRVGVQPAQHVPRMAARSAAAGSRHRPAVACRSASATGTSRRSTPSSSRAPARCRRARRTARRDHHRRPEPGRDRPGTPADARRVGPSDARPSAQRAVAARPGDDGGRPSRHVVSLEVLYTPYRLRGGWPASTEPRRWLELLGDLCEPGFLDSISRRGGR